MKQADFKKGQVWRVLKPAKLWAWEPLDAYSRQGWSRDLQPGEEIRCLGVKMTSGDGAPMVHWFEPGKVEVEFRPYANGMWDSAPADGFLELVKE